MKKRTTFEEYKMQTRRRLMAVTLGLVVLIVGTSGVFAQDASCSDCHNDTTLITGKATAWAESGHGTGTAYVRGTSSGCAGCHSGGGFSAMVAAGQTPDTVDMGDPNPTRQSCRACHQIHTSYTGADWALETTAPVALLAVADATYEGGKGNLCANCHQPRSTIGEADADGMISVSSTHWGPHHGPQSAMLLGVGGAGVEGEPSDHYYLVEDTCVTCHMGATANHSFDPSTAACAECHDGANSFDIDGVQTEVAAMLGEVAELLKTKGLMDEDGHAVVGTYPAAEASALWNYIFINNEDKSLGVHNASYTMDLLEAAKAALQ
jgi:hypothetical protein